MVAGGEAQIGAAQCAEFDGFSACWLARAREAKAHAAFGFMVRSAGARDAGDADSEGGRGVGDGTIGHFQGDGFGDGTVRGEGFGPDAEHVDFGLVGIGDKAAIKHIGRSGNIGEGDGDHTASAGFGAGDRDALSAGKREDCGGSIRR